MTSPRTVARTTADQTVDVTFTVNGTEVATSLPARVTLSDALRDHLGLTGTHVGCEHGICGMCTVMVDGQAARACLLFAVQLDGAEITTVEGLGTPDDLHPLQEALGRHHGLQCGFCTPGFLMSSYDLLSHSPDVEPDELPEELSGVLCRCTGYRNIVDAVAEVAAGHREGLPPPGNCRERTLIGRSPMASSAAAVPSPDTAAAPDRPSEIVLPAGEPTVRIEVMRELEVSPEDVAVVLRDVHLLARCLPGAELTEDLGDDWYRGRARVALGPVRLSFAGIAQVAEQRDDHIGLLAQGADSGGGGAQAGITLDAIRSGNGTTLIARASVHLTGRVAGFGRSLAGDVSRQMFEQFAASVERAAAGEDVVAGQKPPGAFRLLLATLRSRVRNRKARRA